MSEQNIAGRFLVGDAPLNHYAGDVPWVPLATPEPPINWPFASEIDLRKFIRKEVHAALDTLVREMRLSSEVNR